MESFQLLLVHIRSADDQLGVARITSSFLLTPPPTLLLFPSLPLLGLLPLCRDLSSYYMCLFFILHFKLFLLWVGHVKEAVYICACTSDSFT